MEQVGGDHYKSGYQHWDWAVDVGLGPLEYGATRYICRHWKKDGVKDLRKAQHFIKKLMELNHDGSYDHYKGISRSKRSLSYIDDMNNFVKENKIPYLEACLCNDLAKWQTDDNLFNILSGIVYLIQTSEMGAKGLHLMPGGKVAGAGTKASPAPSDTGTVPPEVMHNTKRRGYCGICGELETEHHICGEKIE